jgi:ABC-type glycerol-3-phosphate transport system substrate-binding protein
VISSIENLTAIRISRVLLRSVFFGGTILFFSTTKSFCAAPPQDATLQVLHWWTSASERKAAGLLAARAADEGLVWRDVGIPGGAGIGAGKVLKSRVLASDAPEVTQIIGASIGEWAELGFLLELDKVARINKWNTVFFPTIQNLIQYRQHVVAAPLGIHRINTLFYNRKLFATLKLVPPESWDELVLLAAKLKAAGVIPLAQSSEPWQLATLFENLILAESGPEYHRELFVKQNAQAVFDHRFIQALERFRLMKSWMSHPVDERSWTEVIRQFSRHEAAMTIMGDWAKGELNEWALPPTMNSLAPQCQGQENIICTVSIPSRCLPTTIRMVSPKKNSPSWWRRRRCKLITTQLKVQSRCAVMQIRQKWIAVRALRGLRLHKARLCRHPVLCIGWQPMNPAGMRSSR